MNRLLADSNPKGFPTRLRPSNPPSSAAVISSGPSPKRTAWKKSGTTLSKGSGVLLLAFAAIVVLGALFVVFSLLE